MKKIYSLLICAAMFACSAQAQLRISGATPNHVSGIASYSKNPSVMTIDTLQPAAFSLMCDTAPTYYGLNSPDKGYATGNCLVQGVAVGAECAQRYAFSGNGSISEALVWYGVVKGTSGSTTAKIYTIDNTTKKPMTSLGSSAPILTGALTTTAITTYAFSPAISVTTDFAVSAVFTSPANGDTVAVVSTKLDCISNDSLGSLNFITYGWYLYTTLFNSVQPADTGLELFIMPVIDITTGVDNAVSSGHLSLQGTFPNPAKDISNINYSTSEPAEVSVQVFDLTGRDIYKSSEMLSPGSHTVKLSVINLPAGNYYYTIRSGSARLTSKFSVAR